MKFALIKYCQRDAAILNDIIPVPLNQEKKLILRGNTATKKRFERDYLLYVSIIFQNVSSELLLKTGVQYL